MLDLSAKIELASKHFIGKRIFIFITRKCNLNCPYCNVIRNQYADLSLAEWHEEFKYFDKFRVSTAVLMGGEPTERKDLLEIIKGVKRYSRAKVNLVTNLIRIKSDPAYAMALSQAGLDTIAVSINNFAGLPILADLSPLFKRIVVNTIISKNNIGEIKNIALRVSQYKNCFFSPLLLQVEENYFSSSKTKSDLPDYEDIRRVVKDLIILKLKGYPVSRSFHYLLYMKKYVKGRRWNCKKDVFKRFFAINNDGRLMVCQGTSPLDFKLSQLNRENIPDFKKQAKAAAAGCPGCLYDCTFDIPKVFFHFFEYLIMFRRFF